MSNLKSKPPPPPPPSKPKHLSSLSSTIASGGNSDNVSSAEHTQPQRSSKRGLGWPWDTPAARFSLYDRSITSGHVSWLFNWELWRPEGTPPAVEWVPCVRTAAQVKDIDPFLSDITRDGSAKINHFLGFNEPEIPDQANLSPEEAVNLWTEVILPAKAKFGFRLGSPGMSSDLSRCRPWLDRFFELLGNGRGGVDFLVVHWYGLRFQGMKAFLEEMHRTYYGLPVWVNEFACSKMGNGEASSEEVEEFVREALPWLEECSWVEHYAYFGHGQGGDVGSWVGKGSNFVEADETSVSGSEGMNLSKIGRLYVEM